MIRKIRIRNFRSIVDQTISTEEISILVGNNDAGKSNVLRALNLFFNGETDHNQKFDFESDFSINAQVAAKKAKEIVIELILKLPPSYRKNGYETVYWKKVWRSDGERKQDEVKLYADTKVDGVPSGGDEFLPRVKIVSLLESIKYFYIPAIRDKEFFLDLQGKIYDAISSSYGTKLHRSANEFEGAINSELGTLIFDLELLFLEKNKITLPRNLRPIFENLEIQSDGIPLSRRGDGIKARHIPAMLKFIKEGFVEGPRRVIYPQIWGFEEPENNVEFSSCYKLREDLIWAANEKIQIFLTTHSPIIYMLKSEISSGSKVKVARHYVSKEPKGTVLNSIDDDEIHQNIGFMPLISNVLESERKKWKAEAAILTKLKESWEREVELGNLPHVFVEGVSDKVILERSIDLYAPDLKRKINFFVGKNGSANAAADRAMGHYLYNKHRGNSAVKCILLLDDDQGCIELKKKVREFKEKQKDKCGTLFKVVYVNPRQTYSLLKDGFLVEKCLEAYYPLEIWEFACEEGWLEEKSTYEMFSEETIKKIVNQNDGNFSDKISSLAGINYYLAKYKFTDKGKREISNHICNMGDEILIGNECLKEIGEKLLPELRNFLFP